MVPGVVVFLRAVPEPLRVVGRVGGLRALVLRLILVVVNSLGPLFVGLWLLISLTVLCLLGVPSLGRVVEVDRRLLGLLPCSLRGPGSRHGVLCEGGPRLRSCGGCHGVLFVLKDDSAPHAFCLTGESFGLLGRPVPRGGLAVRRSLVLFGSVTALRAGSPSANSRGGLLVEGLVGLPVVLTSAGPFLRLRSGVVVVLLLVVPLHLLLGLVELVGVVLLLAILSPLRQLGPLVVLPELASEFLAPFQGVLLDLGLEEA